MSPLNYGFVFFAIALIALIIFFIYKKETIIQLLESKQKITIIAAFGKNNELGKDNKLIWYLPNDLKRFKRLTTNHFILMGRNTFESIGKPLPNRTTVIVTRNKNYKQEGCLIAHSLTEAINLAKADENPFIIGGAQIYNEAINLATHLEITYVDAVFDADVFFPKINTSIWKETAKETHKIDAKHKYAYRFVSYERRR